MNRLSSTAILTASVLSAQCLAASQPGVVSMSVSQSRTRSFNSLSRRNIGSAIPATLSNNPSTGLYLVNGSVGTPPQDVTFMIDTARADTWVFAPGTCEDSPQGQLSYHCAGGSFQAEDSETFTNTYDDDFAQSYAFQAVAGTYFNDTLGVGDTQSPLNVTNLTMAHVYQSDGFSFNVLGLGYRAAEAAAADDKGKSYKVSGDTVVDNTTCTAPTFLEQLVAQGSINKAAYSLWLNDQNASSGDILFGGIDRSKFVGELVSLPIQQSNGTYSKPLIQWTSLGLTDITGSTLLGLNQSFPALAILDSTAPYFSVPNNVYDELSNFFAVEENKVYGPLIRCNSNPSIGTLNFAFGGPNGAVVAIPFSELAVPLLVDDHPLNFTDGTPACQFPVVPNNATSLGNSSANDDPDTYILGTTFMRSAYLVFDLDLNQVAMAQTNYSAKLLAPGETDIQVLGANDTVLPIASTTAYTLYTVSPTSRPLDVNATMVATTYAHGYSDSSAIMSTNTTNTISIPSPYVASAPMTKAQPEVTGVPTTYSQAGPSQLMSGPSAQTIPYTPVLTPSAKANASASVSSTSSVTGMSITFPSASGPGKPSKGGRVQVRGSSLGLCLLMAVGVVL